MKKLKIFLEMIIPKKIIKIRKYLISYNKIKSDVNMVNDNSCFPFYSDNYERHLKYSNNPHKNDTEEKLLNSIVVTYHGIEKGITMGSMNFGFGQNKVIDLILMCNKYLDQYNDCPDRLKEAVYVIQEYCQIHKNGGFPINILLVKSLTDLTLRCRISEPPKTQLSL